MNSKLHLSSILALAFAACNNLTEVPEIPQAQIAASSSETVILSSSSIGIVFSTLSDPRDGRVYKTVLIGDKEWTVDNMNFKPSQGQGAICPGDSTSCDSTGYLYDWPTATGGVASNLAPSGVQGVCPSGWHIPSDLEFAALMKIAGDSIVAGYNLKSKADWGQAGSGSDLLGFGAKPIGYRDVDSTFYGAGAYAYFWSTTEDNASEANIWYIGKNNKALFSQPNFKQVMASVRCMRNLK